MPDTETCTGWLFHLPEHHHRIVSHAGCTHFTVQFFGFTRSLANAAEQADAFVLAHDVVDQLRDQNRLANSRTAKQTRYATTPERRQKIDRFDAGREHLRLRHSTVDGGGMLMQTASSYFLQRLAIVDRIAKDIQHPSEQTLADRNLQRTAEVFDGYATSEPLQWSEGDGANGVRIELTKNLGDHPRTSATLQGNAIRKSIVAPVRCLHTQFMMDPRQSLGENRIQHAAANRDDASSVCGLRSLHVRFTQQTAYRLEMVVTLRRHSGRRLAIPATIDVHDLAGDEARCGAAQMDCHRCHIGGRAPALH